MSTVLPLSLVQPLFFSGQIIVRHRPAFLSQICPNPSRNGPFPRRHFPHRPPSAIRSGAAYVWSFFHETAEYSPFSPPCIILPFLASANFSPPHCPSTHSCHLPSRATRPLAGDFFPVVQNKIPKPGSTLLPLVKSRVFPPCLVDRTLEKNLFFNAPLAYYKCSPLCVGVVSPHPVTQQTIFPSGLA